MNIFKSNFGSKFTHNALDKVQKNRPLNLRVDLKSVQANTEEFLIGFLAGADTKLLKTPELAQDRKKYATIGTSVLFTALLAGFSGGYAFFTAVKVINLSLGFGILWAGMILNLDRSMLISMSSKPGKQPNLFQKVVTASPRLLLSIAIGVVISTPLTLKVFEKEIDAQIEKDFVKVEKVQQQTKQAEVGKIQGDLLAIQTKINKLTDKKSTKQDELDREIQGKVGSGKEGEGSASKSIRENIQKIEADLAKEEAAKVREQQRIQPEIDLIEQKYARESKIRKDSDGFLSRFAAREEIKHHNSAANLAIHSLEILLIAIEVAPLLIKLMAKDGNYERAIKIAQQHTIERIEQEAKDKAKLQSKQQLIDYENQDNDLDRKILLANIYKDPQNFNLLLKMFELDTLKLDLRNKLLHKLLESIEKHTENKQEFDNILSAYGDSLDDRERDIYQDLFAQLQALTQGDVRRNITLLDRSPQTKLDELSAP
ncbi:DUF4407 domain-containing protein [Chamaesiphon polymorphus]|uniref:DUF4407 domain-containing protein n=1 Tax=Chamaesiphon polymorphus CCALA 037 TaxID=2107692 RepID=A0A2T1GKL4_9CYAN|nr:DUF4407 domain-containing protein [Chamaesiphon polymorphus]PSB58386.1 hypothetical protein C7B77_04930 [Chamaesiphon polymorphus CCALA 037]